MTDSEIAALAAAFKSVIEEQGIALRAQIADLRADLDTERQKSAQHRLFEAEARQRTMKAIGATVGEAISTRFSELQLRTVALENRAMQAAP